MSATHISARARPARVLAWALGLVLWALPLGAAALDLWSGFARTTLTWTACVDRATAVLGQTGWNNVEHIGNGVVFGRNGEYSASVVCVDQVAVTFTVGGPSGDVAATMGQRISAAF